MPSARDFYQQRGWGTCAIAACLGLLFLAGPTWAANEYEYAQGLMDMDTQLFKTEDLMEHLIKKLAQQPNESLKLEGMLIEAAFRRKQAKIASAEKRQELLSRADELYKAFLEKGKGHRLLKIAEDEKESIALDHANALVKAAEEKPEQAAALRNEAAAKFEKIANERMAESDKYRPLFKEKLKAIQDFFSKNPEVDQAPSTLVGPAQQALEQYIPKNKLYVIARMEEVGAYPDGQTKTTKAHELAEYCKAQIEAEDIGQLQDVCMWYWFIKGRLHSMILEEEKATEAWRNALDIQIESFPPAVKQTVFDIKKLIYRDLVKMKLRTADKSAEKFKDVIDIVRNAKYEPAMKTLFDEPIGKDLLIDFCHSLTKQPGADSTDYEQAIKELRSIVAKGPPWSNNAARAMAEILTRARTNRISPNLTALEWFDTARGFYLDGQRAYFRYKELEKGGGEPEKMKALFEEAFEQYENAVENYRRAIGRARIPNITPVATRLKVEPEAWFEMGTAYLRMEQYYESIIAFEALRSLYQPEARKKWLPDAKDKSFYGSKEVKEALAMLDVVNKSDSRADGILSRAKQNIVYALKLNAQISTPFNKRLKIQILEGEDFDSDLADTDYQAGKLALDTAKELIDQGVAFVASQKTKAAQDQYAQALVKLKEAAERFEKVKPSSKAYEVAMFQVGSCYTQAQSLLAGDQLAHMPSEERMKQNKEFGAKALQWYDTYERYVAKEQDPTDEGMARRKKLEGGVKVNRTTIYYSMQDWAGVLKSSEDYIAYETSKAEGAPDPGKLEKVYFNIFRALSHLGGEKAPPECDDFLEKAAALIPKFQDNKKFYVYAIQTMSLRYNNAAAQAEKNKLGDDMVRKYESMIAEYQGIAMKEKEKPEIDDYGRLLSLYEKAGRKKEAADIADKMLKSFDPEGKNCRVEDSEWPILLNKMYSIIKYSDLGKWDRCKNDHMVMLDLLYETTKGQTFGYDNPQRLPPEDQYAIDYDKALAKIQSIKNNYKDCATVTPVADRADHLFQGKSYISFIEEEVEFRRRIIATRDLLSDIALGVATELDASDKKEEADIYRKMAGEQINILLEVYGNVPDMKRKLADIKFTNREFDEALKILVELKNPEPPTSEIYIKASKRISEIHFAQKDFPSAARYPAFIAATAGLDSNWIKKWWPDMNEFLEKCYANGAPRPKKIAALPEGEKPIRFEVKTFDEKEFEKLHLVYTKGKENPELAATLHDKTFLFKYEFIKGKIAHFKEYEELERTLLGHRGAADEKEVLTDDFMKRYELIKKLVAVEQDAWSAFNDYDTAVVERGGHDRVPAAVRQRKTAAFAEVEKLTKDLTALAPLEKAGK